MPEVKVNKDLENRTVTIECTFDAPKEKLWNAYTNREMYEKWWGPEGWETTTKEFNFAPGGRVHYCMKCVDEDQGDWFGQESWGVTVIESVDPQNGYQAQDYFSDETGEMNREMPSMRLEVEFREENGRTTVINRTITETAEQLEELIKMGMVEGFSSQVNKLEALIKD